MDGLACLLEIPTWPRCSGQLPLTVWGCLFVGTVLEMEPRPHMFSSALYLNPTCSPLLSSIHRQSLFGGGGCLTVQLQLALEPGVGV